MAITLLVESDNDLEQRLLMPGKYSWEEFEALEALLAESPGLRITYLDGLIEFMAFGEPHELIKKRQFKIGQLETHQHYCKCHQKSVDRHRLWLILARR